MRAHAVEALNFQITWNVVAIVGQILAVCTASSQPLRCSSCRSVAWAVIVIFSIIAGLKANEGQLYKYPVTVRLVK